MRLQGSVVAYSCDVRERSAQLRWRSCPSEARSGYLFARTAQSQVWLIPESDARLVQVESQGGAGRWYLALKEKDPLPLDGALGGESKRKMVHNLGQTLVITL